MAVWLGCCTMRGGLSPAIVEPQQREQYLTSLHVADLGDLLPFTMFMAQALEDTQQSLLQQKVFAGYQVHK